MKYIFTLKCFAFSGILLLCAGAVNSQTACNYKADSTKTTNVEDFNSSDGGFTTSDPSFAYAPATGDFRIDNTLSNVNYSIKSRNYALFASADSTTIGFMVTAKGAQFPGNFVVSVYRSDGTLLVQCTDGKMSDTSGGTYTYYITLGNAALQSTTGTAVYYVINFPTLSRTAGEGGSLVFDNFKTNASEASALPVTFTGFDGRKTPDGIALTWTVAGESNVKQYDVERSTSGNGFVKIGSVPATGSTSYSFTDNSKLTGTILYRIKSVDNDGRFQYSTLLSFRNGVSTVVFRAVPTLVASQTMVQHEAATYKTTLTLITADGRLVRSLRPATGATQTRVDMTGLQAGLYLLRWDDGAGNAGTVKLVKQ